MDVLDGLRVGAKVSEGRFRIDQKRALEKLKKNRLATPEAWICEVLRAAQASHAKRVDVRTDADDVEVGFDGRPFPAHVMKHLLVQALGGDDELSEPRHRLFALGVAGAMGLGLKRLFVQSGKVCLEIDAKGDVHVEEREPIDGTVLKARKAFSGSVVKSWLTRGSPEGELVRLTVWGYQPKLFHNGAALSSHALPTRRHHQGALTLYADAQGGAPLAFSVINLHVHGVRAGVRYWRLPGVQLEGRVFCDAMRFDASGGNIVDTDPHLTKALTLCRQLSLELLREAVKEPTGQLREQLAKRLLEDETLDEDARELMRTVPLFHGPAGERWSVAELHAAVKGGKPLYVATKEYVKGSYPEPTVLLGFETGRWEKLLPGARREDVADHVRRKQRAAENRLAWEQQPPEPAVLPERHFLGTADLTTAKMKGQVGIEPRGEGAWVRLLAKGRFLQEGEVPLLSPYRLRAVVDLHGPVSDKVWDQLPNDKLWSAVVDEVERAAEAAICAALRTKDPWDDVLAHARDVLARRSAVGRKKLPKEVLEARLFELLGGGRTSLQELEAEKPWRFVRRPHPHPPLDGSRVLVLDLVTRQLLEPYANGRLHEVTEQLEEELLIRRRLAGPKVEPVLSRKTVSLGFERDGMRGEVGISHDASDRLHLTLLREGFALETTRLTSRYGPCVAIVECPALQPTSDWKKAVRDATFERVVRAVGEVEQELAGALLAQHRSFSTMPLAARGWLLGFVKKELSGKRDGPANAVFEAKLLDGPKGPISLAELKALASETGTLWLLPAWRSAAALDGQAAVTGDSDTEELVRAGTGFEPKDGSAELERAAARAQFLARPPWQPAFDASAPLHVAFASGRFTCTAAYDPSREPGATCQLIVQERLWRTEELPASLPMRVAVRLEDVEPTAPVDDDLRQQVARQVLLAQEQMVERALDDEGPHARRALFAALHARLDDAFPLPLARRLRERELFECTDGAVRSAAALDAQQSVPFVTRPLRGEPRSGKRVVLALDPDVALGLRRFTRDDVTEQLELELEKRAERLELKAVERIALPAAAVVELPLHGRIEGVVGLSPAAEGRLDLLFERRPLCIVPGALPLPLTAAVNCDALEPLPAHDGVVRDAEYRKVIDAVEAQLDALGRELARRWPEVGARPGALEAALRLCALLAPRQGKKKKPHPLLEVALLQTTSGAGLTVKAVLDEVRERGDVLVSERWGSLLGDDDRRRFVWRADWNQQRWLQPLKLETRDATEDLERADRVRSRPRVERLVAPLQGGWRQPVSQGGIEGEVALPEAPTGQLVVELYQQRALLERYETEHPFGGAAAVNFDALTPNATWTKAARNTHFRAVRTEIDKALEHALAKRLLTRDRGWRAWAENAARWATREAGPVADVLPQLELFETLAGEPVTAGAALAEYAKTRRVAVAGAHLDARGGFVLRDTPQTRELLEALGATVKDVSPELLRQGELEAERRARRVQQLSWPGEALARVKVKAPGITGELALPATDSHVEVTLAKQGIRVQALPRGVAPGVAGVVDLEGLLVDESWTEARLAPPEREVITAAASELLEQLCRAVPSMPKDARAAARRHVLAWLGHAGVKSAAQLDRLTGANARLATAPVFETAASEWVGAHVLAGEVKRRGRVAVFEKGLFRPDTGGVLGLVSRHVDDAWLKELEQVLGSGSLERVKDPGGWREALREEDPPPGSPELWGLQRLRRDVKLLRAGALGVLSPEELEDVRLKALGGRSPVHYDVKRRVVLLDSQHPQVMRALSEARLRRERLYVLLAAMYGAVNRALAHVTDEHEEQLMTALAAHLSENPQLLEPGEG